jgi:hypothetical protein
MVMMPIRIKTCSSASITSFYSIFTPQYSTTNKKLQEENDQAFSIAL